MNLRMLKRIDFNMGNFQCEEIVKVLRNKLIQFNEENINMPTKIIDFVWEEMIYKLNINIKF